MLTTITTLAVLMILYGITALILSKIKIPTFVRESSERFGSVKMVPGEPKRFLLPLYRYSVLLVIAGIIISFTTANTVKVKGQDVGILITPKGVNPDELETGWHFVWPWNDVEMMDKTIWVYTCAHDSAEGDRLRADAIWAPTKDGIKMGFDVSLSWSINPDEAAWIYQTVTENDNRELGRYEWLEEKVIRTKIKNAIAMTVRKYTPIEAYSFKREDIQKEAFEILQKELKEFKLLALQLDLREVFYNKDFEVAINAKKLAEQEVLRLVEVTRQKDEQLLQATIDKNIAIELAKGEKKELKEVIKYKNGLILMMPL